MAVRWAQEGASQGASSYSNKTSTAMGTGLDTDQRRAEPPGKRRQQLSQDPAERQSREEECHRGGEIVLRTNCVFGRHD